MLRKWHSIIPNSPMLSIYLWIIFCFLPFFFIFRKSSYIEISIGITFLMLYFIFYRFSMNSKSGLVYMWISFEMVINIVMTILYGYVYLSIFTAFFIGNIRRPVGFYIMYGLHIGFTVISTGAGFFVELQLFLSQLPFVVLTILAVVLLPLTIYSKNKRENLEGQLETANERIAELIVFEERQRIARDLHDTLGQKLSMIGLKSDLASRLIDRDPQQALVEIKDIRQTASIALKEVRELVSDMRTAKFEDELMRISQILKAAEMEFVFEGDKNALQVPPLVENVLSMCLKEAVNNVVKHSGATKCEIAFHQNFKEVYLVVRDNGQGITKKQAWKTGNGLKGMRERLEFINGSFKIESVDGTTLSVTIPVAITHQSVKENLKNI
ncbi:MULTISPECIES: sensor histidine kinase [Lysinibacillus]|uniref:histidine kinase n=3 Tax=Lysinibacillus TaxID=400634 RepID=A0A1H9RSE3_9BACI|nr:two-component system, NarL family, sensor histidine kinase DesK [Lysinibacillus fusiformis]SCY81638.1 two-component system, NarL family, sensor histidine kinase DesK [Lysinibacillus fusiformis]SDB55772.1 two-component system, NarL family, sensor histidine kinase DesK [Lysinibacillus fusiformis]SEO49561.1 two-component system, NarL family, sensor histidine kinase DesK [Lysinibacillus fusiformis]SER74839.1 two-component system, NarL family, sensor histidine kinase DesK [Lysinibacillus fusiform